MISLKNKITHAIYGLKKLGLVGIKAEFEAEGATFDEISQLDTMAQKEKIGLTVKIGGAGAITDIISCKKINAKTIVAPMIESEYALLKFVKSISTIYHDCTAPDLFVNIETQEGYRNIEKIMRHEEFKKIKGIVLGRDDMAQSLNEEIESPKMLRIAKNIAKRCQNCEKTFIIGGKILPKSNDFLKKIKNLEYFETRKMILKYDENTYESAVLLAIRAEIMWLQYVAKNDKNSEARINLLKNEYKNSLCAKGGDKFNLSRQNI